MKDLMFTDKLVLIDDIHDDAYEEILTDVNLPLTTLWGCTCMLIELLLFLLPIYLLLFLRKF